MLALGIDVGGTNFRVGVFQYEKLVEQYRVERNLSAMCSKLLPEHVGFEIIRMFTDEVTFLMNEYPEIDAIGIGFPGFIDPATKIIAQSPNLPGLTNINLAKELSQQLGKKVMVVNDANAAAYGEYCLAGKPPGGLIYLGLGTGVGGGLIINGKPHVGANGCAMEVGHIIISQGCRQCGCGNLGCMETYASATGVCTTFFELTKQKMSAAEIAALADAGNDHALFAYQDAANALAQALASILKVIDVSNVVIGGGLSNAWHLMQKGFYDQLENDLIPVLRGKIQVSISTANDTAGMLGAAMLSVAMLSTATLALG
jgi:glucokinase